MHVLSFDTRCGFVVRHPAYGLSVCSEKALYNSLFIFVAAVGARREHSHHTRSVQASCGLTCMCVRLCVHVSSSLSHDC